jgi:hypothetical protein
MICTLTLFNRVSLAVGERLAVAVVGPGLVAPIRMIGACPASAGVILVSGGVIKGQTLYIAAASDGFAGSGSSRRPAPTRRSAAAATACTMWRGTSR